MTPPLGRKWRGAKKPLDKVKEESEKVGLKLNIRKTKIMASGPITSWEIDGETVETVSDWMFIGRTDAEAETRVLWPPDAKSWLIGKDSDAGRDWGQEEKGTTENEMVGWHHQLDGHGFE